MKNRLHRKNKDRSEMNWQKIKNRNIKNNSIDQSGNKIRFIRTGLNLRKIDTEQNARNVK